MGKRRGAHQNQHVWDGDNIRLIPHRHGGLKVVGSVLPVRHSVVGMKCDVVLLDLFSGKHFERKTLDVFYAFYMFASGTVLKCSANLGRLLSCFCSQRGAQGTREHVQTWSHKAENNGHLGNNRDTIKM